MTPDGDRRISSTQRREEARASITRTTVTPAPMGELPPEAPAKRGIAGRLRPRAHGDLTSAEKPFAVVGAIRLAMAVLLSVLCLLTVGGAILVLLLWQQDRASGVLTSQLDRTWDLFDMLRVIERWTAFTVLAVATAWIVVATINVHRATGVKRSAVVAALSLPVGAIGAWMVGRELVATADDRVGSASGFVLQAIFLAIPLLALLRVAETAEARNLPLRATFVVAVGLLAQIQFLGGLSTLDRSVTSDEWGQTGAYLIIGALIQLLGALSANEAARAIEDGTAHRYSLRSRFGESLLAQALLGDESRNWMK